MYTILAHCKKYFFIFKSVTFFQTHFQKNAYCISLVERKLKINYEFKNHSKPRMYRKSIQSHDRSQNKLKVEIESIRMESKTKILSKSNPSENLFTIEVWIEKSFGIKSKNQNRIESINGIKLHNHRVLMEKSLNVKSKLILYRKITQNQVRNESKLKNHSE